MRIDDLEIDDHVRHKLEDKHRVSFDEVAEAVEDEAHRHVRRGRDRRYYVFGRTAAGRYLWVVLAASAQPAAWRVVTARDMTDSERKLYKEAVTVD